MLHSKTNRRRRWPLFTATGLILLGIVLIALELTGATNFIHHKSPAPLTASSETKGETQVSSNPANNSAKTTDGSTQPGDQKSDSGGSANSTNLLTPTGQFVSNHHPGQNGSPVTETSVCNTTPGATCQIVFSKDGITKSLRVQTTDRGGSTYWNNWKASDIGLTAGSWSIRAIAVLGNQTQTASDTLELVVQ